MLFMLDTNVLIEIRRNNRTVLKQLLSHSPTEICYSVISIALADGMTVVTHNVKEFQRIPNLLLEDWQEDNSI